MTVLTDVGVREIGLTEMGAHRVATRVWSAPGQARLWPEPVEADERGFLMTSIDAAIGYGSNWRAR